MYGQCWSKCGTCIDMIKWYFHILFGNVLDLRCGAGSAEVEANLTLKVRVVGHLFTNNDVLDEAQRNPARRVDGAARTTCLSIFM